MRSMQNLSKFVPICKIRNENDSKTEVRAEESGLNRLGKKLFVPSQSMSEILSREIDDAKRQMRQKKNVKFVVLVEKFSPISNCCVKARVLVLPENKSEEMYFSSVFCKTKLHSGPISVTNFKLMKDKKICFDFYSN